MKNNILYRKETKEKFEEIIILGIYITHYLFAILLLPITIIIFLLNNKTFKKTFTNVGWIPFILILGVFFLKQLMDNEK